MNNLMELKDCELEYKETVDTANNFMIKFRKKMLRLCRQIRDLEIERCLQIHSSINQFVVYEMSAEMNNKYDVQNFAKLLEEFSPQQEMRTVDKHLYGVVQAQRDDDFEEVQGDGDRSTTGKMRMDANSNGVKDLAIRGQESERSSLSEISLPKLSESGHEQVPEEEMSANKLDRQISIKREESQAAEPQVDEITVLPNSHIPVVLNSKFEFVPFESRLKDDQNPVVARIDIN